jgi:BirA family transcriptional regulator, biotin operon repressor / biotin---[acetyl-CoA-carboxylase] ligase
MSDPTASYLDIISPVWLHWLESCSSTNTWALEHFPQLQHGDVVFTQRQTAGRGQDKRIWYSPAGVFTASFILSQIPSIQLPGLPLALGLAAIYAIEDLLPHQQGQLGLKWPNDVLFEERKLAGILCESIPSNNAHSGSVVIGIGLNHRVDFAKVGLTQAHVGNAISLHQLSERVPDELELLERLRHYILQVSALLTHPNPLSPGLTALLPALRDRNVLYNRLVTIEQREQRIIGQVIDIDSLGRLLVQTPNQPIQTIVSGRIIHWQ